MEQGQLLEGSAGRADLGMYVDISADKSVTTAQGQTESTQGAASEELLTVIIPLPAELSGRRNYTVVRTDGSVGAALSDEADPQTGEYYEVSEDATTLILHVKESALYAVGYRRPSSSGPLEPSEPSGSSGTSGSVQAPQVQESENGSFTFGPEQPEQGEVVTVTPVPDEGYEVAQVTVVEADGSPVTVTPGEDGTYSFVQPGSGVTISVVFRQDSDFSGCLRDGSCPLSDFTDLEMDAWYHDGIHFCLAEGLMQGVSDALFEPDRLPCQRHAGANALQPGGTSRRLRRHPLWRRGGRRLVCRRGELGRADGRRAGLRQRQFRPRRPHHPRAARRPALPLCPCQGV